MSSDTPHTDFDGYVVYSGNIKNGVPFGVVSDDHECKAIANYIPRRLKEFIVEIEDRRFYSHNGVDFKGIARAIVENIKAGSIKQGGSTITQQLARNLLRDNSKTFNRKLKETIKAYSIEANYTKDEIIELYFNNIYFGRNLRGIRTAGLYYFQKELSRLSHIEFLALLTILRGPNYYIKHLESTYNRFQVISKILLERKQISRNRYTKNGKVQLKFTDAPLQILSGKSIPFIIEVNNSKDKIIKSTIDSQLQKFANSFVINSKYPVSVIAVCGKQVKAFASSYGSEYPFISKSNVGSTLKPFLYCYLRDAGITNNETFRAYKNNLSWDVREVTYVKDQLNLQEALYYSNNNSFINACDKIGMDASLQFLSGIFNKDISEFYPSSILGATKGGISLYQLATAYSVYFNINAYSESKIECLSVLRRIAKNKLGSQIENAFLKTGTTNENQERFAVLGDADLTFAVLRNENPVNDDSKEGGFLRQISKNFSSFFARKNYTWG